MTFAQTIRRLRQESGSSQQEVAEAIGVVRATYTGLENDRREPNLKEIKRLAEYYQVAPNDLIDGTVSLDNEPRAAYSFEDTSHTAVKRDVKPEFKPEKLREVLLYLIEKVGAKHNVGETVLYKLLYFIDFDYYEVHGKSITGMTYVRNHFGPTPKLKSFSEVVEGMKTATPKQLEIVETDYFKKIQRKYLPTIKPDLRELSAEELEHINEVISRYGDKTAAELTDLSHKDTPWRVTKPNKPIDYRGVFYRTSLTAVTEPEDEL